MRFRSLLIAALAIVGCSSGGSSGAGAAGGGSGGQGTGAGSGGANGSQAGRAGAESAGGGAGVTASGGSATGGSATGGNASGGRADGGADPGGAAGTSSPGGMGAGGSTPGGGAAGVGGAPGHWKPAAGTTFYWDLSNAPPDNTKNVGAYDIDGWNNTAQEVGALHARGIKVVCYMDAGSYEPGRLDSASFPAALKGAAVQGWPGEFWLDVRPAGPNYAALQAIMLARFKACQQKGFDAVEPDNLDSYQNSPGFNTSAADQLAYNKWIATTVHSLGLAVFQKNDLDQIAALEPSFDGILDEECNKYSECSSLAPYTAAGKPVWDAEYQEDGESTAAFCPADIKASIAGALFALNLDGSLFEPCANDVGMIQ